MPVPCPAPRSAPPDPQGSLCASPWQSLSPGVPWGAAALTLTASACSRCQRAVSQPRCSLGLVLARGDELLEHFIGVTHALPRCSPHVLTLLAVPQGGGGALRCREQLWSPSQNWWGLAAQVGVQAPCRAQLKCRAVPVPPGSLSPAEPPCMRCCPLSCPSSYPAFLSKAVPSDLPSIRRGKDFPFSLGQLLIKISI